MQFVTKISSRANFLPDLFAPESSGDLKELLLKGNLLGHEGEITLRKTVRHDVVDPESHECTRLQKEDSRRVVDSFVCNHSHSLFT